MNGWRTGGPGLGSVVHAGLMVLATAQGAGVGSSVAAAERWGVVVGVENYRTLGKAKYAADDARLVARVLRTYGGFPERHVVVLADGEPDRPPTGGNIEHYLRLLLVDLALGFGRQAPGAAAQAARPSTPPGEITNSIGMKLVYIKPGSFMMGSPENEKGRGSDEGPRHRVHITHPFYLGAHEVTVGQFRRFVEATGYRTDAEKGGQPFAHGKTGGYAVDADGKGGWREDATWRNPGFPQTDAHPVVLVSWNDAHAFCRWLSRTEGKQYRLPTEAQSEYACRGGTDTVYWWGDDGDTSGRVANVADQCLKRKYPSRPVMPMDDGYVYTSPVGTFRANPFRLHDMIGNVWEWCEDWYARDYYEKSPASDPTGPAETEATKFSEGGGRVLRGGGCYLYLLLNCRCANRDRNHPANRLDIIGFRMLLSPRSSE